MPHPDPTAEAQAITTANRLLAADMLEDLTEEQWRTPSLCAGWTVREVAAHMLPPYGRFAMLRLLGLFVRYRGNLERLVDQTARRDARKPTAELVALLREHAAVRMAPPVVGAAGPLADSAIHLRDITRPLGLDVNPAPEAWRPVLDFLVSRPASRGGFLPTDRLSGLRLAPTDQDRTWGEGAEVRGTSEALAMVVTGRTVAVPELTGPGVETLRHRLSSINERD